VVIKDRSHAKKRHDSLEHPSRISTTHRLPFVQLDAPSLTRIFDSNRRETDESADRVRQAGLSRATQDALLRLAANPQDACALVAVYDTSGNHLKASAVRWFGRDVELQSRAVLNILVAIARQAGSYDPQTMSAGEWVRHCADAEARSLREALGGTGGSRGRRTRRAV
jgi:hypothetical protein